MDERDVKHVAKHLLSHGDAKKQAKERRKLLAYVTEARTHKERASRLATVLYEMRSRFEQDRNTAAIALAFFDDINAWIYEGQHFSFIIALIEIQCGTSSSSAERAIVWFSCAFFRYTGATLDRSSAFALFLLEESSRSLQEAYRQSSMGAITDAATTLKIVSMIIRTSMTVPFENVTPMKLWFERIIEGAYAKNAVANEILTSLLGVIHANRPTQDLLITETPSVPVADAQMAARMTAEYNRIAEEQGRPLIVLSPAHHRLFDAWTDRLNTETRAPLAEGARIIAWFHERRGIMQEQTRAQQTAIAHAPRRWLRPNGFDHVDINVTPLRNAGIRAIAFHPEWHTFPHTGMQIVLRKTGPNLLLFPAALVHFRLTVSTDTFTNHHYDPEMLHALLEYITIDILWRIVVGERKLRPKQTSGIKGPRTSLGQATGVSVPFHKRMLPAGQRASEEAKQAAARVGWTLREDETFVQDYDYTLVPMTYEGGRIHHHLPTEPIASYGDADLMDLTDPT